MSAAAEPLLPARGAGAAPGSTQDPALDAQVLAELTRLDPRQGRGFLARLLLTYRESLATQLDRLGAAHAAADWSRVHQAVHALKSASASVGALGLARCCAALESAARQGEAQRVGELLPLLVAEAARVDGAVQRLLSDPQRTGP